MYLGPPPKQNWALPPPFSSHLLRVQGNRLRADVTGLQEEKLEQLTVE